ncbi:MAG TPA: Fe2+-dependent dioxygenase [Rhizomicrobium sp.]|jgi:PKHD-type hydroxylase|nr:Fe2+-dependent dioxygenase [Rhizomicrobium sp.]
MFLQLPNLLTDPEIARLQQLAGELNFQDGRLSNPANVTKDNLQADASDPRYAESSQMVSAAFGRSREFRDFAFPRRMAPPMLTRYEPGMKYGPHADVPHMTIGNTSLRSDLSATVFLSHPSTYEGGELVIHLGTHPVVMKGLPGQVVVYPSTTLHEVRPVTSGARLVAITFIESMIPDENHRGMVYELNEIAAMEGGNMRWENRARLETVRYNLTRMWTRS